MGKRARSAQIQLSFSMIFSIIVIIAVVAVAFYVIKYFVGLKNCTDIGLFYNDLQKQVDDAWQSQAGYNDKFSGYLPSGIREVCIGNMSAVSGSTYKDEYTQLSKFKGRGNLFLYPLKTACDSALPYYNLQHIENTNFFCIPSVNGKIEIKINKESFGPITLTK